MLKKFTVIASNDTCTFLTAVLKTVEPKISDVTSLFMVWNIYYEIKLFAF